MRDALLQDEGVVSRKLLFHLDARGAQETKLLGLVSLPTAQSTMTLRHLRNCSDETFVDGRCGQWVERIMRKIDNEFE
jgi:hypothetical protein